jgi:Zn-dependent protease with chaperone function
MKNKEIQLSTEFKTQATKAIVAIVFFALTYILLLLFAGGITALSIAAGIFLIVLKPMFITIALGIGLASMGVFVLIFLLKFIFKSHKVDRSHLVEINIADEPDLFRMIDEVVTEVGTSKPKKVYISSEVNAAVFYDSIFWSMFFPIKKNLQIGLGLVNTITKEELKAILSHEFGHFSQRTMKVGSYVYNVNQVIFNMLFDNESYDNLIERWANASGYFTIFVVIAVKINQGIQWVLRKLYGVVNKSYMGLSREMEFHADEIAASVTGHEPLKNSLLRMTLAETSFNEALSFFSERISDNSKSENIYTNQIAVLQILSEINKFPIKNNLPDIKLEEQSKFDKSKLVIKDQWASHPTVEERVKRLGNTGFNSQINTDTTANSVFRDIKEMQKQLTKKIFESVEYQGETNYVTFDKFQKTYKEKVIANSFSNLYNGYYDNKNPTNFEISSCGQLTNENDVQDFFSDEKVDLVYTLISLQNDIVILKNISDNLLPIKTFDYDGVRYKQKDAEDLIEKLKIEMDNLNEQVKKNDINIYNYFSKEEAKQNKPNILKKLYIEFFEFDKAFEIRNEDYVKLSNELHFINITTPFEQIKANFDRIKPMEEKLKSEITYLLNDSNYQAEITNKIRQNLERYISREWTYFSGKYYSDENLDILHTALQNYAYIMPKGYFNMKKKLLMYQEELINNLTVKA